MANTSVARSGNSRVFLIEGRARPDHVPSYENCLRMTGVSQAFGDITSIECPDPLNYGKFIEVAQIRGAQERATTTLEGRYAMDLKSTLMRLAKKGCAIDLQLHLGECTDPSQFNTFKKAVVLENATLTNFSTDDLGAIQSDQNAAITETTDVSAESVYEVLPISFALQGGATVVNEVIDAVICDSVSCGECTVESDGCQKLFAITKYTGGSPPTLPDIVFETTIGGTIYSHDIEPLTSKDPSAIDCIGDYIVIVSNAANALEYALKSQFNGYTDPSFTEVTTGFVALKEPNDIFTVGNKAFIVGDGGYVYLCTDPTSGVTVLDAGSATTDNLNRVNALDEEHAVAVGNSGAIIYTVNGLTWTSALSHPVGAGVHLQAVWMKSELEWWIGTSTGRVFYTLDAGASWTEKTFSGSGAGRVDDIVFVTNCVGYLAHTTATPRGRILRTYDGGRSWVTTPEGGTLQLVDRVNRFAYCSDANYVVGVGLADDASDGFLLVGGAT